ncbi:MAG TPA: hypothetical protein VIF43_02775 [Patescibacteria group bacterium]|jgi:hypothetical protein
MADDQSRTGQAAQAAKAVKQVEQAAKAGRAAMFLANPAVWIAAVVALVVLVLVLVIGVIIVGVSGASPGGSAGQVGSGGSASCGELTGTPKDIIDDVALPIAHEIAFEDVTPESVEAANAAHSQQTTSGNTSEHKGPPEVAWAADISNGTSPTPEMDQLAEDLASCFGIQWNGSGLVNGTKGGYRFQLIYRTDEGGDHYDHVHIGVSKQ